MHRLAALPFIPFALFSLSLAVRLCGIGQESLMFDEANSRLAALGDTWRYVREVEANPPLYFYLLRLWVALFGSDVVPLRAFSALTGSFAPALIYAAARRGGMSVAASSFAGAALALAPINVWFGQHARCYAPLTSVIALWLWLAARLADEREPSPRLSDLAALVATLAAGTAMHYFFPAAILGGGAVLLLALGLDRTNRRLRALVAAHACGAATWFLWSPLIRHQLHGVYRATDWVPRPSVKGVARIYTDVIFTGPADEAAWWIIILILVIYGVAAAGAIGILRDARARQRTDAAVRDASRSLFLFASAVGPVAIMVLRSLDESSMFIKERYPILGLPALVLFVFHGADRLAARRGPRWTILAGGLWVSLSLIGDARLWTRHQAFPWREAGDRLRREWTDGDAVVFVPAWLTTAYHANNPPPPREAGSIEVISGEEKGVRRVWLFHWEDSGFWYDEDRLEEFDEWGGGEMLYRFPTAQLRLLHAAAPQ